MIEAGIPAMRVYFFGFFMMSLQFAGQAVFVGLGKAKRAVFFSIFRKIVIVTPLDYHAARGVRAGNHRNSYGGAHL